MANWQDELESLLASFGVALEAPALDQLRAEDSLNTYLRRSRSRVSRWWNMASRSSPSRARLRRQFARS